MYSIRLPFAAIMCLSLAAVLQAGEKSPSKQASDSGKTHAPVSYLKTPLSFVPNVGQSSSVARFLAQGPGYTVELEPRGARLSFAGASGAPGRSVTMDLVNARHDADMRGEDLLPGKYNYFPTSNPKTWFSNVPSYSKVRYATAYPGVDVAFYGNANRLEYDFLLQPGARADQIRMGLGGVDGVTVNSAGDLVLRTSAGDLSLLKPVAYQMSSDGKRQVVKAGYHLEAPATGESAMVSLALGSYDHHRALVIDPVFALNYSEYLSAPYVGSVASDNSGNSFVTGNNNGVGLYVAEFNSIGAVVYNTTIGTGAAYPTKIAIDGTGRAYIVGRIDGGTLPTASNSYKSSVTASMNGFYVQVSSTGASVPYATFLGGTDTSTSAAYGLGVDSSGNSYLGGYTYSGTFPVTGGVYQSTFAGTPGSYYDGWVAKINPAASGSASLVYSTYLGSQNSQVLAVGVDSSGNAYAASAGTNSTFPVTSGAFRYNGYDSSSGGVYVTKLNSGATALVYSAYLGYGTPYSIAVEGQSSPSAYVTGFVQYADFPTTPGAYQTSYAGGFVTKMSADGSSEVYSTFLGGPSSYAGGYSGGNTVVPWSIALPNGCASSCNAYISGRTNTNDFPTINAIQNFNPTPGGNVAFIVELAANGDSALFSTYLSGFTQGFFNGSDDSAYYGFTPAVSVDSSGDISFVGDLGGSPQDFPVTTTIPGNTQNTAVLARIDPSASPYAWATPTTINFGNQPIGVSTSIYNGSNTANTVHLRNMSATPITISSIVASSSIFSESDDCLDAIAAGAYCTMALNFTPAALGARTGTVTVTSNASDSPTVITLTGSGYDSAFEQISPQSLSFGNQAVGTSSAPQTITVTNLGDEAWAPNIYSNSPSFTETNNCPSQVAPGASCVINVTFTPTQVGLISSSIGVYGATGQIAVGVNGTGTTGTAGTLAFSAASLQFGNELVGITTAYQAITIQNTSSVPVTIQSLVTAGDFALYSTSCALPGQLNPQASCIAYVTFTPTAAGARTGTLTITDSASGSPQTVALTGTGLAAVQTLEFYPGTTVVFPDQPVGFPSGTMTIYAENTGTSPITIDRVLVSGDFQLTSAGCAATVLAGNLYDGNDVSPSYSYCSVNVTFTPTATGFRTGTLTFIDSEGTQTMTLTGSGITDTGILSLEPTQLDYNLFPIGTTSPVQYVQLVNPGNTPITINSYSTGASDFAVTNYNCGVPPFVINPNNGNCDVQVSFTPTAAGNRTGTLTVSSSAGNKTVALLGTGEAASQAIAFTPTSPMNSGSVVKGQTSGANGSSDGQTGDLVSIRNTGTSSVTFSANPTVTGTNASDFVLYNPYSCGATSTPLAGGSSCPMWIRFTPSITGAETATLSFTDSAPSSPQALTLNGTGIAAAPAYSLSNNLLNFDNTVQGATSALNTYIRFYNNSGASVTLGNIVLTGDFLIPSGEQTCNGTTVTNGSSCYAYVEFSPTAAGNRTGTITFKNSGGTTLASAPLTGFAPAPVLTALLDPTTLNFTTIQVVGTSTSYQQAALTNTGNLPITIGTITGTNLGTSPTNEFSITSNGGSNGCTPSLVINPGGTCTVYPVFTPNAAGAATGTLVIPVTYTGGSTGSFTLNLTGTGVAEKNSAVVSPSAGAFVDETVGVTTNYNVQLTLTNSGNQPFTVGTVSGTNLGAPPANDFSDSAAQGGTDQCTSVVVAPGNSCSVYVRFTPSAAGVRSGTVVFPVTFKDSTTASPTATLSGTGIGAGKTLQITPASIQFQTQVVSTISTQQYVAVKNIGNASVTFTSAVFSGDFALGPNGNGCSVLTSSSTCYIYVSFAPTASGARTGTLTINDNATNNPQVVNLSGTGIAANKQIALSQSTVAFGNQPQGSTSTPQAVYVTNQGDTTVTFTVGALAGTNPGDYTVTNNCPGSLGARAVCTISFTFAPAANASGTLTATLPITTSVTGETSLPITLTGTAVAAGPAVAFNPSPLTFPLQNVGTTSAVEKFTVTNTGSANLTITSVVSTNPTEFAIPGDGCSGATLTPGQNCPVSVTFSPILGGTRSGTITVTDNATGSPQSLTVTGIGYGIPALTPTPTSLTFTNQNIGTTSAAQSVTLSNPGTDTLHFTSITITGVNAGDFALTATTCGATLAPAGTCSVSVKFTPTASGSRGASITLTDNANNAPGSTQTVPLTGTGVAVPTAGLAPTTLTFSNTNIGSTSAAKTATLTNSGTGPLTIASIAISGTNAGDYAETNNCGASLVAGTSCTISVTFTPTASGTRTATVTITDNANNVSGSTQTVSLTGTGVGVPAAALSPNVVAFTDTNVGVSSSAQTVTLSNSGTAALTIASIAFTGANPGDFSQTNTCAGSVAAGGNCTISVTFKPTAPGNRSATLTVTDNANNVTGSTQTAAVSGTGIGVPVAGVSPSSLTFASTSVGVTTAAQTVTVTNTGTGPLTITQIVIGAANAGDFAQTNNCGSTLAVSGNCTISVTFTPTAAGTRTASLHVVDNSNNVGSTQTVTLSGTGVGGAGPVAGVAPTSLTFASQNTGTTSPAQPVTLSNTGTGPLAIASIGFSGTNASEFGQTNNCGTSLAASTSCTISVTFSPTAVGSASATLTVTDNSGNVTGSTQNVTLSGTGASGGAPTVVSLTPTSGTGLTKTFTAVYSDPNGISDFNSVIILFNTSVSFANGCAVLYTPGTNTMYLYNNAGTALLSPGVVPGSSGTVSNSQCTINGTGSSFSTSGNNLTLNAALTFAGTFVGSKNVYLYAKGSAGNTGFVQKGTWLPASNGAPTITSVTPSSGTGLTQTFTAVYSDPNGASDLQEVIVLFNTSVSLANACAVVYAPVSNTLYLYNNAGTALTAGITPGSSGSVSNSQCILFGTGSSVTSSGNTMTLNANVTFTGTFTGLKQILLYGAGQAGNSGWVDKGTWTP